MLHSPQNSVRTFFETPCTFKCSHVKHLKENRPMTVQAVFLFGAKRPVVLHPTKEGQFPRDPIFFGQTPHP